MAIHQPDRDVATILSSLAAVGLMLGAGAAIAADGQADITVPAWLFPSNSLSGALPDADPTARVGVTCCAHCLRSGTANERAELLR